MHQHSRAAAAEPRRPVAAVAVAALVSALFVATLCSLVTGSVTAAHSPVVAAAGGAAPQQPGARRVQQLAALIGTPAWQTTLITNVQTTMAPYRDYVLRVSFNMNTMQIVFLPNRFEPTLTYAIMLGAQLAICLVVGLILSTFGCFFYCSRACHCCCCCCKQNIPRPEGYSCCSRYCVWIWLLIFALGMGVGVFFSLSANDQIGTAITEIYAAPQALLLDLSIKLTNLSTGLDDFAVVTTDQIQSIRSFVSGINAIPPLVNATADAVRNITLAFASVGTSVNGINNNITAVKIILQALIDQGLSGVPSPSGVPQIPNSTLQLVQDAYTQSLAALSQVQTLGATVSQQIAQVNASLGSTLDSAAATAIQVLNTTKQFLTTPQQLLAGISAQINSPAIVSVVGLGSLVRQWVMFGFVVGVMSMVFWPLLFGTFQCCSCCACLPRFCGCWMSFWGFTAFFWLFLLMGLHLAFGIGFGDICKNFTQTITTSASVFGLSTSMTINLGGANISVFTAIFDILNCNVPPYNMFDALGLGNLFNLSAQFSLGNSLNVEVGGGVNISQYNEMLSQFESVSAANFTSFGGGFNTTRYIEDLRVVRNNLTTESVGAGSRAEADQRLLALNQLTGFTVLFSNVSNVDPNDFSGDTQAYVTGNKSLVLVFLQANETVNILRINLTTIDEKISSIPITLQSIDAQASIVNDSVSSVRSLVTSAGNLQTALQQNISRVAGVITFLQGRIDILKNTTGSCTTIGVQYARLVRGMCTSFGGGSDIMWLGLVIIILCLFACCILGVLACQRWCRYPVDPASLPVPPSGGNGKGKQRGGAAQGAIPMNTIHARGGAPPPSDPEAGNTYGLPPSQTYSQPVYQSQPQQYPPPQYARPGNVMQGYQ